LILKKLFDVVGNELERYLRVQRLEAVHILETLWNKYYVSLEEINDLQNKSTQQLEKVLSFLGYVSESE